MTANAVSYGRNSSAKQKSINEQLAENRTASDSNGWHLVAELSDPTSASRYGTKVRENWTSLKGMLPTIDVVILWEPSRGDRTLASWAAFLDRCREHQVRIHAVTHNRTYDPSNARDYRTLAEDGVDSAYESDKISARVRRGQGASAAAGRPHAPVTYGFQRQYHPTTRAFLAQVEHPGQASVVRDIISSIAAGESLHAIATRLNQAGVPTARTATAWRTNTLRTIALNPAYVGKRSHRGQLSDAVWEPIVDEGVWAAAGRVLGANSAAVRARRKDSAPGKVKYLLSGSADVMAAACGSRLSGNCDQTGRSRHYSCEGDRCASAPMGEVDEIVTRLVIARLSRKDARLLWVDSDDAATVARDEVRRLQAELDEVLELFTSGDLSARAYAAKEQRLLPAIQDAQRRAEPVGVPLGVLQVLEAAQVAQERVRPAWDFVPLPAKREAVAYLFEELVLLPATERITRWTSAEDRLSIVAKRIRVEWRQPTN